MKDKLPYDMKNYKADDGILTKITLVIFMVVFVITMLSVIDSVYRKHDKEIICSTEGL